MAKRTTRFYRKNEAEVMQSLGFKPCKGSGAGWIEKGDGQNEFIIGELKSTDALSMRIHLEDIHKLEFHAATCHKVPVFIVQFMATNEIFMMARPDDFTELAKYLEFGECEVKKVPEVDFSEVAQPTPTKPVIKSSKSKNREKFWKEKEEDFERCRKSRLRR